MKQTTRPPGAAYEELAEVAYDFGGWDDNNMDLLAYPLQYSDPATAFQGAVEYREVIEGQLVLSEAVLPTKGYRLWIEDEIPAAKATIWGLKVLEQALSAKNPVELERLAPKAMSASGVRAALRAVEPIAARPRDLNVRAQACREWLEALESSLRAEEARDFLRGYLDWPVYMLESGEVV